LLSSNGVGIEDIADLCGHSGTTITESVYRHQLRPVLSPARSPWTGRFGAPASQA
jgi:integrase